MGRGKDLFGSEYGHSADSYECDNETSRDVKYGEFLD